MPNIDITYCSRECSNVECKRNKKHIPEDVKYVSMSDFFGDCSEWRGNIFNLSEDEAKRVIQNKLDNTDRDTFIKQLNECGFEIEEVNK